MFGYVRTDRGELRVREYEYYRALYCGLCHRMGKCTGQCSRLALSYDFVFLAAVRLALTGERTELKRQRCFLHPFRRRVTVQQCAALDFCADASALLSYHKLADDLKDERGLKRLRAFFARPLFWSGYRRAKKRHPVLERAIADALSQLSAVEKGSRALGGADLPASHFGQLMAAVLSEGLEGANARIAAVIGRALGHWIYLVDAADDFADDRKRGRFNPYIGVFGDVPSDGDAERLRLALTAHLCDAEEAINLIDTYSHPELKEIILNILYLGLPQTAKRVTAALTSLPGDITMKGNKI